MSTDAEQGGLGKYIVVYVAMLVITLLELITAYRHPSEPQLLVSMLLFAFIGAALGILYFMHLASENHKLIVAFAVFTLFVLATINYGWTDSFRILHGAPFAK
ncbi:MAG: cytochrome C oxidase subunit IV family protein [Candidatus Acidiferrum sp.]